MGYRPPVGDPNTNYGFGQPSPVTQRSRSAGWWILQSGWKLVTSPLSVYRLHHRNITRSVRPERSVCDRRHDPRSPLRPDYTTPVCFGRQATRWHPGSRFVSNLPNCTTASDGVGRIVDRTSRVTRSPLHWGDIVKETASVRSLEAVYTNSVSMLVHSSMKSPAVSSYRMRVLIVPSTSNWPPTRPSIGSSRPETICFQYLYLPVWMYP